MFQFTQVTAASPAQSGVEWVAIAGIVGTLLGIVVGAVVTWKVQKRQLAHEDRTRFHQQRLSVYAEFNTACEEFIAGVTELLTSWTNVVTAASAMHTEKLVAANERHLATILKAYGTLRLVASQPVREAARRVHAVVSEFKDKGAKDVEVLREAFNIEADHLVKAMRAEIQVDPKSR